MSHTITTQIRQYARSRVYRPNYAHTRPKGTWCYANVNGPSVQQISDGDGYSTMATHQLHVSFGPLGTALYIHCRCRLCTNCSQTKTSRDCGLLLEC